MQRQDFPVDHATDHDVIAEDRIADLPDPVRRHLTFAGVVGRPLDRWFEAELRGWFRTAPDRRWAACRCHQRNSAPEVTRTFRMRTTLGRVVPVRAEDTYSAGRGRLRATAFGLFTLTDEQGPELDAGELATFLADALLLAPSMLLSLPVEWSAAGEHAYHVALTDLGRTVTGRVELDGRGAPRVFTTEDRWALRPGGLVRTRWSTPVDGWLLTAGRVRPRRGTAVWHLPGEPFAYAQFDYSHSTLTYGHPPVRSQAALPPTG
ncbi:DUF6544 family protein [Actinosynnema sp. NPDC050436]|uniref:DUF6544 family protein n=1 Tax=Actinosynnema sp. NPDC050436 TaxID=3155659 RepID=UPI0033FA2248